MVKGVETQLLQKRRQRHLRIYCNGVAQRQRAVRGQFAEQSIGERFDGIIPVLLGFGLAADRDDRALDCWRGRLAAGVRIVAALAFAIGFRTGGGLVLRPDIAAVDRQAAVGADADKDAGANNLGGIVGPRPVLEGDERGLDLAEPRVDFIGQLVGAFVFGFELSAARRN